LKSIIRKIVAVSKNLVIWSRIGLIFSFLYTPLLFLSNLIKMTKWIANNLKNKEIYNDFFVLNRDHSRRYKLYEHVLKSMNLDNAKIVFLEFGVFGGNSFEWWIKNNSNKDSRFYGFDTFEGLPEDWGTYNKGDMSSPIPNINDERISFIKGLFQDSLFPFLDQNEKKMEGNLVIHLDADLFSSTLFVLTTLARYLKKDDIILFDEFNVPNHEFMAYKHFTESFYIDLELIGSVNNFYQVAFRVK
jgi:O-methyltransferase